MCEKVWGIGLEEQESRREGNAWRFPSFFGTFLFVLLVSFFTMVSVWDRITEQALWEVMPSFFTSAFLHKEALKGKSGGDSFF